MNFVDLVTHGLAAWFANQEVVATRMLVLTTLFNALLVPLIGIVVGLRIFTNRGVPGWATSTVGLLLILGAQSLIASTIVVFSTMANRTHLGFVPIRDYRCFVRDECSLFVA